MFRDRLNQELRDDRGDSLPNSEIRVTFWGVRGGLPAPGAMTQGFGGNSPCIEMRCNRRLLIFDAGTGIRALGKDLMARSPVAGDLFFSTTRFNHICGLPFFAAAFNPANSFRLWCGNAQPETCIKDVLSGLMNDPIFPVPLDVFNADLSFRDFTDGIDLDIGDGVTIATSKLNGCPPGTAYRVTYGGRSVCYLAGACLDDEDTVEAIVAFAGDADMIIFGPPLINGQSKECAWTAATRLATDAQVSKLVLSGHAPEDDDDVLNQREEHLAHDHPGTVLAREGQEVSV